MQAGQLEYGSQIPGYEALGYVAPSGSAFVVRADALQKCNWHPTHSKAAHIALGQELKLQGYLSHYLRQVLAVGEFALPPDCNQVHICIAVCMMVKVQLVMHF